MDRAALIQALGAHRLDISGSFAITAADGLPRASGSLLLISPDGAHFWDYFTASAEYLDGTPDPLDRWSRRIGDQIAQDCGALALYPFGGPPHHPFYDWALRTGRAYAAPIGLLVHDQAGLFISYRMALLVPWHSPAAPTQQRPCDACARPCTTACPVSAFAIGYDVAACKNHLRHAAGQDCMTTGCAARRACPIGQHGRPAAQSAFHMKAFQ